MNKKILTLSLVAVATTALSIGAVFMAKNHKQLTADAYDGSETIILDKDSIKNVNKSDADTWYFDLEGDHAFGYSESKYILTGVNIFGANKSIGGDHLFEVSNHKTEYYWAFQIPEVKLKGTHQGFVSMNFLKETDEPGTFDALFSYNAADVFSYYDADKDLYNFPVYEQTYSLHVDSLTIDRITITYTCAA